MPKIDIFYLICNILYFISYISYRMLYIFIIVLCESIAVQLYAEVITKGAVLQSLIQELRIFSITISKISISNTSV